METLNDQHSGPNIQAVALLLALTLQGCGGSESGAPGSPPADEPVATLSRSVAPEDTDPQIDTRQGNHVVQWPGLAERKLYQGRDLQPTTDLRAASKQLLMAHYKLPAAVIDRQILPGTARLTPLEVLRT